MKTYKLNWRFWGIFTLLAGASLLGIRVLYMLLTGQVQDETGPLGFVLSLILFLVLFPPVASYVVSVITMLKLIFRHQRCGLQLTHRGIENSVVFIYLLAFIFVLPVKCIPWESVKYYDGEEKYPYIRVNTKLVAAGGFARLLLKILGYMFCVSFVKPAVTNADIAPYKHRFAKDPDR